jgi:hypothetical protein
MTTAQTIRRLSRAIEAAATTILRKPIQIIFMNKDETTGQAITRHFADHPGRRDDYEVLVVTWDWMGRYAGSSPRETLVVR